MQTLSTYLGGTCLLKQNIYIDYCKNIFLFRYCSVYMNRLYGHPYKMEKDKSKLDFIISI